MDVEKGNRGTASGGGAATGNLLTAVSMFVSCLALAGLLVVLVQNHQMQGDVQHTSTFKAHWVPDSARQEKALREVHDVVKEHLRSDRGTATTVGYACQNPNRRPGYYNDCTDSPRTPNSSVVPSAHIVPDGALYPCTIEEPSVYFYAIISVGWTCGCSYERIILPGYVRGGMIFDRDIGALVVPVEGIYFVYSQVHVNVSNPSGVLLIGTQTFICEESRCRSTAYLVSQALTDVTYGPFYHGGLFHLNANSTIKIAAWFDASASAGSLAYSAHFTNTFFGAYLVEEISADDDL